jgi:hypothetical protein
MGQGLVRTSKDLTGLSKYETVRTRRGCDFPLASKRLNNLSLSLGIRTSKALDLCILNTFVVQCSRRLDASNFTPTAHTQSISSVLPFAAHLGALIESHTG